MKTDIKDIISFIGDNISYDEFGDGCFWGKQSNGKEQMIAEMRGYGAVKQKFFNNETGFDKDKSDKFQADLGNFIAEAINEKILKESK